MSSPRLRLSLWLLTVWLVTGGLLASLTPPWAGEDEFDHFNYAYNLYRSGRWTLTYQLTWSDNTANQEFARYQPEQIDLSRPHRLSTFYQYPAYYAFLARAAGFKSNWSIISLMYYWRYLTVLLSAGIACLTLLLIRPLSADKSGWLMVSLLWFNPMFRFITSQINSAAWEVLFTSAVIVLCYRLSRKFYPSTAIVISLLLLLLWLTRQTTMFLLPVPILALLIQYRRKELSLKATIAWAAVFLLPIALALPVIRQTNQLVQYLPAPSDPPTLTPMRYLIEQLPRIRYQLLSGYWQEQVAMVPLWMPQFWLRFWQFDAGIGITLACWSMIRKRRLPRSGWWIALPSVIILSLFLIWWDYLNLRSANQHWFKGRYLFAYIMPVSQMILAGWLMIWQKLKLTAKLHYLWPLAGGLSFLSTIIELILNWYL